MGFKEIPDTDPVNYISGLHSLNLDLRDGTGAGWHFSNMWLDGKAPIKLYGKGKIANTIGIYGYFGIADRSKSINRLGASQKKVYIADHIRAALDSVYESIKRYKHVGPMWGTVDHFFVDEKKQKELFMYALYMREHLDEEEVMLLDDWLSSDFRTLYKRWKSGGLQEEKTFLDIQSPGTIK